MKYKNDLDKITPDEIISKIKRDKIAIYRNIELVTEEKLVEFCQKIGDMLAWDFGHVMHLHIKKESKNYLFTTKTVPYHWDGAFHQEPQLLVFFCLEAPQKEDGGETLFCNTEAIIRDLSSEDLDMYRSVRLRYTTEKLAHYGGVVEADLVQRHPLSNNIILRFAEAVDYQDLNPVTVEVVSVSNKLDKNWRDVLIKKLYDPVYCYAHSWKAGDLVIADNFSLLHARNAYKKHNQRHLLRAQILKIHNTLLFLKEKK